MKRTVLDFILVLLASLATLRAAEAPQRPMMGRLPAAKVLFLGNSITLHAPAPGIGWMGNWGMAASAEEKDFVHLLTADIANAAGAPPKTMVRNAAGFEREYETFDLAKEFKGELEFSADMVVVAIGENVPQPETDEARAKFAAAFARLLATLKEHGAPVIFVRSSFWPEGVKDGIMRKAAAEAGATFVDIAALGGDASNAASAERKIEHPGVAGHPGDKGMRAIADAIFSAMKNRAQPGWPDGFIGYSELQTDLPGGRHVNTRTMRACVVKADGTERREVAAELATDADTSTQFAGWSPDGTVAVIHRGWKSAENGRWEEENKTFRFTKEDCLLDAYFVDLSTGKTENVTAVDRVSFYNSGVFFWPKDSSKLGFTALVDGNSHPFRMDRDGRNKTDLTSGSKEFSYGFSTSRDGKRIAYHKNYQIFLADADGSNAVQVQTGQPFNFGPTWSPDGQWVLFVSGEHYDCHPAIVRTDGTGLKKIADRGGYRGVVEFLDVPDFHGGSSDTPVWTPDSKRVIYTAKVGENVELFSAGLDGVMDQLTKSAAGTLHYHPQLSPDGGWLTYGSKREGVRQLYVMRLADRTERRITNLGPGHAAMWPHWQPEKAQDGIDIQLRGEAATELAPHGTGNVYAPEVRRDGEGWLMWYGGQGRDGHDRIHLARSADGRRWTKQGVVLDCGTANHVNDPSVVRVGAVWWMFYTVAEKGELDEIAAATSFDGVSWEKRGVVLRRGEGSAWDSWKVGRPSVLHEGGVFRLWFDGQPTPEAAAANLLAASVKRESRAVGYAESHDGLVWVRRPEPVFREGAGAIHVSRVGGKLVMLIESHTGVRWAGSEDGLTWISRGPLLPLSGGEEDRFGQVTPFLLTWNDETIVFFGAARRRTWDGNTIGVVKGRFPSE